MFGRTELFIISVIFYVVGTVVESKSYNVQTYAGGAIIFQFGLTGVQLLLQLMAGDFSLLNWRLISSFVPALPFIINTWVSGNLTAAVGTRWSMGIWMWAIIFPGVSIPLILCLFHMRYKAKKNGDLDEINKEISDYQRLGLLGLIKFLFFKLDVIGIFLLVAFFALILVPLTLAGGLAREWKTAKIIAPLVVGFLCIPVFIIWERFAPSPIVPFKLIRDRGVWSAFCIAILINFVWYMQGDYMYTILIVSVNQTFKSATRITQLYSFVSVITGAILGLCVTRIRYLKPFIVFGTVCWLISMGMLIHFRGGTDSKSGIIGSLCFLGFGAGFFTYPTQVSLQSVTDHDHMAVITSLYLASYYIGSALGSCVSGAIWTQVLAEKIREQFQLIGNTSESLLTTAYGSPFTFIVDYPWGTPERMAVVEAYKQVQRLLLITGTCLCVPLIGFSLCLRNPRLLDAQNLYDEKVVSEKDEERGISKEDSKGIQRLKLLFM